MKYKYNVSITKVSALIDVSGELSGAQFNAFNNLNNLYEGDELEGKRAEFFVKRSGEDGAKNSITLYADNGIIDLPAFEKIEE